MPGEVAAGGERCVRSVGDVGLGYSSRTITHPSRTPHAPLTHPSRTPLTLVCRPCRYARVPFFVLVSNLEEMGQGLWLQRDEALDEVSRNQVTVSRPRTRTLLSNPTVEEVARNQVARADARIHHAPHHTPNERPPRAACNTRPHAHT